ncbi:NTR1 protein [Gonium pectorale]|uniref:thioredoxin-disulfide reductase (NADPH) n=1 Tax=Gonium pectorale TaxID=33097 RepID=A0A150GK26_GONPE|nr:NTR1 protein [Gonium pectorale]|eukprot:KXZ50183.1 NTR1 protein [Gonium pectorale]
MAADGAQAPEADGTKPAYEWDLVVIGGGSGGLACAKEAAKLGKKVCLLDYVVPSPQGTTWGLGGTCVNVGCIPKKLFHQAGLLGEGFSDARGYGWKLPEGVEVDWEALVTGVQGHIGSLNWGYRVALREASVKYMNAKGSFVDAHTVEAVERNGKKHTLTAERIVVAVGGRPKYLGVPGDRELCVTSDDIFSRTTKPGKTLVVGASYIALECAGFLHALGFPVAVMARSIFLRGFDQEIAELIGADMERRGVRMIRPAVPVSFEKDGEQIKCTFKNLDFGLEMSESFDTVLLAVGRDAVTSNLGLDRAGVVVDPRSGKIPVVAEQTNVPWIYAIGDVLENRQELTPVAIKAGVRLARRLYAGATQQMDYDTVPTTVFTPLEYGCVGYSEEAAAEKYGADNIEVYVSYLKPLEWTMNHEEHNGTAVRPDNAVFCKLITDKTDDERVVGVHYLGPNAGEITQGMAVALKAGATKAHFDDCIGIHPTIAEEFTILDVTKRSGKSALKKGC